MSELKSESKIFRALRHGKPFSLDPTVKSLDFSDYTNYGIQYGELFQALKKNTTLTSLKLNSSIGVSGARQLADVLKENLSLTSVTISGGEFLSDLFYSQSKGKKVLARINDLVEKNRLYQQAVTRKVQEEMKRLLPKLEELVRAEVQAEREAEEAKKQQEEALARQRHEEALTKERKAAELKKQQELQAQKRRQEEEQAKKVSDVKAWIDANNWEALAMFIKDHPDFAITNLLATGKYNLNTVTFVNQLSAHTVQRIIEELEVAQDFNNKKNDELLAQQQVLVAEEEDLKRKLEQVRAQIQQVTAQSRAAKNDLEVTTGQITKAKDNLKEIQKSLAESTPKLEQWRERLQVDVSEWTYEDIECLLREINMTDHTSSFIKNKIDGSVLLDLTTSDLIDCLSINFKEAKKLLKSVFLARVYKDIYTTPPGVLQWHVDTVCSWLEDNKFAHLSETFRKQQITGSELAFIDRNDLKKYLKIEALGDCIKLEKAINELQRSHLAEKSIQKQIAVELEVEKVAGYQSELEQKLHEMKAINEELKRKLKDAKKNAPEAFCCPITQEVMSDPVVASDGHTYERVAIEAWLLHHDTSPMTNQRLENKVLTPSHTLKSMIREFVDRK